MHLIIQIKVTPNASKNQIIGWENEILRVKIKGIPEKGKVNDELIAFLADTQNVSKSKICILKGHKSRQKTIKIAGITKIKTNN